MDRRTQAEEFLNALLECLPKTFFRQLEETGRGANLALVTLAAAPEPMSAGDLAAELGVTSARTAALLKSLERSGLVVRRASATDGRKTIVEITEAGRAAAATAHEEVLERTAHIIETVGNEDLHEFIRIAKRIAEVLDE